MGKSSGGQTGTQQTQQTQTTKLPDWVENAAKQNLAAAYGVSSSLLGPWTGPRVAGLTPGAMGDIAGLQGLPGSTAPAFNLAQNTAAATQGFTPLMVNPGSLASTDLSPYMNPYISNVIDTGLQGLETQRRQAINADADQAIGAGAFGGSRHGVQEGVTNAGAALAAGNLASQLAAQGYQNAQTAAQQDIATNLAAQQANQNADITGAGVRLSGATQGGNLASMGSQTFLQQLMAALQGQQLVQGQSQAELDAARQAYQEQQQFPIQQLQIPLTTLGMTPYGQTTTGDSTTKTSLPGGNGLMQGLGGGLGILGALGGLFGAGGAFPLVGAGSLLTGLLGH